MKPTYEQLEQQLAAVVAENAGLKQAITTHSESTHFCEVCWKDDPCSTDDVCYVLNETPATDAAIAKIQAQGVEMVIAAKKHQREIMHADTFGYGAAQESLRELINQLESFAAQLRQGAEQ